MSYEVFYDLSITRDYVSSWGVPEAVREVLQNAIDNPHGYSTQVGEDYITIHNPDTRIPKSSLLLGSSTKIEGGRTIGQFGEGYKIALLVLLRNDVSVRIRNSGVLWTPHFRHSKTFGAEVLSIRETKDTGSNSGLIFEIEGLNHFDMRQIIENTLSLSDSDPNAIETSKGQILKSQEGKLFVNGLFVTNTSLDFGYNIKPQFLHLDRDRKTVSSFDLKQVTSSMWNEVGDPQEVAVLLKNGCPDVEYIKFLDNKDNVVKACFDLFTKTYPDALISSDQDEADEIARFHNRDVKVLNDYFVSLVKECGEYNEIETPHQPSPTEHLMKWIEDNENDMNRNAINNFQSLIEMSYNWRT